MVKFNREYKQYSISPISAAFLVLFVTFFMYQIVGGFLTLQFVGTEITKENAGMVRLFTSISQILFMLVLSILFARAIYNDFTNVFRVKKINTVELLIAIWGLVVIVAGSQVYLYLQSHYINQLKESVPFLNQFFDLIDKLDKHIQKSYMNILAMDSFIDYFSIVLSVALIPAFCEEFLFRGFVQSSFEKRLSVFWSIVLTSIIFAIFHFNPFAIIPLFILGAYFSYVVFLTNSIFYSVVLHFLNNFFTITVYAVYKSEDLISAKPETNYPIGSLYLALLICVLLVISTIVVLKQQVNKRKNLEIEEKTEDESMS